MRKKNPRHRLSTLEKNSIIKGDRVILYAMIALPLLSFLVFNYIPLVGVLIAFADYKISGFKGWVGFDNFRYLFHLPMFWEAFRNTWVFVIMRYLFVFPAPIIFALLLNELRAPRFKKSIQTISTLPNFISWVVVAGIWIQFLSPTSGFINDAIKALGFQPVFFMSKPKLFPWIFTFLRAWKEVGYSAIIYLAAIAGVDPGLYESAVIDGANRYHQAIHVTLPSIKNIIIVLFVLSFTGVLSLFEPIFALQNPMIYSTSEVLDTYTWRVGLVKARYPLGAAIGLFKSTISIAFVLAANFLSKRFTEDKKGIL